MEVTFMSLLITWGWIVPTLLALVFYRWTFRLFGIWIIPEDKVGVVTKKWKLFGANKRLKEGEIFACNGEAGIQADVLQPGIYFWYWPWQYSIDIEPLLTVEKGKIGLVQAEGGVEIPIGRILARKVECQNFQDGKAFLTNGGQKGRQTEFLTAGTYRINPRLFKVFSCDITRISPNSVGIITILDGEPLEIGSIAGPHINGHNNFQNPDAFLTNGGRRGLQEQVVLSGSYNFNPWFVNLEEIPMTEIPISHVGVVVSYVGPEGQDVSGADFIHGNIVEKGHKGVWRNTLDPGKYPINTKIMRVEVVPTYNIVLNWADARTESHNLDDKLSTITVRSKDGFKFNLDVSQIINISYTNAPMVIARFGSVKNLVSQVLEPTIGNYFRNSAQNSDVIDFLVTRSERQKEAKTHIKNVLDVYNVTAVDTLIGELDSFIKDVESPLRKGYYREKGWTQGNIKFDVIIFVSEIDRYKNGESRIKLDSVEIDVDKAAFNYTSAYNFAKNTFLTLRKTADIEWLESENEIRELRKSKLEHLKGALNNE